MTIRAMLFMLAVVALIEVQPAAGFGSMQDGPHAECVTQSGGGIPNGGQCGDRTTLTVAGARIDNMGAGDDCARTPRADHWAQVEWSWRWQNEESSAFVTTVYLIFGEAGATATVDDFLDCDFADAQAHLSIRNGGIGASPPGQAWQRKTCQATRDNAGTDRCSETLIVTSEPFTSGCVASGTIFSCETRVDAKVYVASEAYGFANVSHGAPGVSHFCVPCGDEDD